MTALLLVLIFIITAFLIIQFVFAKQVNDLSGEISELELEKADLSDTLDVRDEKIIGLESQLEQELQKVALLNEKIGQLEQSLRETIQNLEEKFKESENLGDILTVTEESLKTVSLELEESKLEALGLEENLTLLTNEINILTAKIDELQMQLLQLNEDLLQLTNEKITIEEESIRLQELVNELNFNQDEMALVIAALTADKEESSKQYSILDMELKTLTEELEGVKTTSEEQTRLRIGLESELELLKEKLNTLSGELETNLQQRQILIDRNLVLEENLKNKEDEFFTREQNYLKQLEREQLIIAEQNEQITSLQFDLQKAEVVKETLEALSQLRENKAKFLREQLTNESQQNVREIEDKEETIKDLRKQINDLESNLIEVNQAFSRALNNIEIFLQNSFSQEGFEPENSILGSLESVLNPNENDAFTGNQNVLINRVNELIEVLDQATEIEREVNVAITESQQSTGLGAKLNDTLVKKVAEIIKYNKELEDRNSQLQNELNSLEETQGLSEFHSQFMEDFSAIVADLDGVSVSNDRFIFSTEVLFEVARAELSDVGKEDIRKVAEQLIRLSEVIPPSTSWVLRVDGHTDSQPIACQFDIIECPFRDNWELSQARALSVVKYLIEEVQFPPERIAATGFSSYQAVGDNSTVEGQKENRRIELKLTEP